MKKALIFSAYLLFLLVLCESSSRAFLTIRYNADFLDSQIVLHTYYPELKSLTGVDIQSTDEYYDILMLGGSALKWGSVDSTLQANLDKKLDTLVRVHNLASPAHTSLDSYYKYHHLSDKHFDLVIYYHGINEVRANNCPPEVFRTDYSHYSWYDALNSFESFGAPSFISFPFTIYLIATRLAQRYGIADYVPLHIPKQEWLAEGANIKTRASFRANTLSIIELAKTRGEKIAIMTFAFYLPDNYSLEAFRNEELDYGMHTSPVEIWGIPQNVAAGIIVHNGIIEDIAEVHPEICFIDQNALMPKSGKIFNDICHFTRAGYQDFAENICNMIAGN